MADLPEETVPLEGGWGTSMVGIILTSLSLLIMIFIAFYPLSSLEDFVLSLITAASLLGAGCIVLTLVSDYALILSATSIFLLLLYWRLRNLDFLWLLSLSFLTFALSILAHKRSPGRRFKGRARANRSP